MKTLNAAMIPTLLALSPLAQADEDFHFRLGHNVLLQTWTESREDGSRAWESTTDTFKGGWELYVSGRNLNFYLYPGQEGSSALFGYSFAPELEVGLGLSLRKFPSGEETESSSAISPYLTYYLSPSEKETVELTLSPAFLQSRIRESATDGSRTSRSDHGTTWTVSALYDRKLGSVFHYFGSLAVVHTKRENEEAFNQLLFVPVGFRYDLR